MRAWTHAIAFVGALLLGSGVAVADAPARAASANDGTDLSVDAADDASTATDASDAAGRDRVRELADHLIGGRATTVSPAAAAPAGDASDADAADADPEARPLPSRESERLGPPPDDAGDRSTNNNLFAGTGSMVLNTLTALGVVIGLILGLRWVWTKVSGQPTVGASPVVEVLARTPVAPRNHILIVRIGNRILIVGDSSAGLRTLATVDDPDEIADLLTAVTAAQDTSISRGFNQLLNRFQGDYDPAVDPAVVPHFDDEGGDRSEHVVDRARSSVSGLMSRLRLMGGKGGGG
ncbi:MAG: flagellar biosynthetic protein FliO [Phycisphaeraceae bacterium]